MPIPTRLLLWLALSMAAIVLAASPAHAAEADVTASWLPQVNEFRQARGLPAVDGGNAAAASVLAAMAAQAPPHTGPWYRIACEVCGRTAWSDGEGNSTDVPDAAYAMAGGAGAGRFALMRPDWSLQRNFNFFIPAQPLLLDPRATTFTAYTTRAGDSVVFAVSIDRARPFTTPQWYAPERFVPVVTENGGPRQADYPAVLVPPGFAGSAELIEHTPRGRVVVQRMHHLEGEWTPPPPLGQVPPAYRAEEAKRPRYHAYFPDTAGAKFYRVLTMTTYSGADMPRWLEPRAALSYNTDYTLRLGNLGGRTFRALPPAEDLSWAFSKDSSDADRLRFQRLVATGPRLVRSMMSDIDETVLVTLSDRIPCMLYARVFCAAVSTWGARKHPQGFATVELDASRTLLRLPTARFQLFHELGHLVDLQGLSPRGRTAFARAFRAAPGWKRCFPKRSGRRCTEMSEIFANQFACWAATVRRVPNTSNYLTPCLLPRRRFERLLVHQYAFHPQLVTELTW